MGDSSQQTNTQQQTQSAPWAPTQGSLLNLISGINSNPAATGYQKTAANNLLSSATGLPNFGGAAGGVARGLLGGDPTGLLGSGNNELRGILSPIANGSLDPTQNPQIQQLLQTIQQQVHNSIAGQFAGAGRDLSPAANSAEAYGLAQGMAAPLLNQYNQNVQNRINAGSQLFGANYNTAGAMTGNQQAGLGAATQQPGIAMAPALAQLQAAMTKYNLPLANAGAIGNILLPIAGLGGQTSSQGQSNTTYNPSLISQIGAGAQLGGTLAGGAAGLSNSVPQFFRSGWGY